jgi:HD-like signal output (HDOD) protein
MQRTEDPTAERAEPVVGAEPAEATLRDLPAFPPLAIRLANAAGGEESAVEEVVDLLRSDAALSAELLRRANSPAYGFSARIDTLQQALVLLGFDELRRMALASAARGIAGQALEAPELRLCWRHSLAVALLAQELARGTDVAPERAYTAGVMHDIGRLGLLASRPAEFRRLLNEAAAAGEIQDASYFLDRESEIFGVDHTEAGRWLAERWEMPVDLRAVAGRHHDRPSGGPVDLLVIVQYAVALADALGFGVVETVARREPAELAADAPAELREALERDGAELSDLLRARIDALDAPPAEPAEEEPPPEKGVAPVEAPEAANEPELPSPRALAGSLAVMAVLAAVLVYLVVRG